MIDPKDEAAVLMALAGIPLPPDRAPALAAGLAGVRRIAGTLARTDFGDAEPAARFRAPRPESR